MALNAGNLFYLFNNTIVYFSSIPIISQTLQVRDLQAVLRIQGSKRHRIPDRIRNTVCKRSIFRKNYRCTKKVKNFQPFFYIFKEKFGFFNLIYQSSVKICWKQVGLIRTILLKKSNTETNQILLLRIPPCCKLKQTIQD